MPAGAPDTTTPCSCGGHARTAAVVEAFTEPYPIPEYAPASWFDEPTLDELPPGEGLTILDDGRVLGYFWESDSCMLGLPGWPERCTTPTHSPTSYAAFHQQDYVTADGTTVRVGAIGQVGGHASPYVGAGVAQKVYADPGAQRIVARAYDRPDGSVIAGALVPGLTYGDVAQIRRSALSGDWRPMDDKWFERNGVNRAAAAEVEFYDCIGPTLVTRPGLPLVKAYRNRAAAVQLDDQGALDVDPFDLLALSPLEPELLALQAAAAAQKATKPAGGKAAGDLTAPELRWLAEHGQALADDARGGAFPIRDAGDLAAAKSSLGRAGAQGTSGYQRALAWINKRAKALGQPPVGQTVRTAGAQAEAVLHCDALELVLDLPDDADDATIAETVRSAFAAARTAASGDVATAGGGAIDAQNPAGSIEERVGMIERFLTEVVGPFIQSSQDDQARTMAANVLAEIDGLRVDLPGEQPIPLPA